MKILNPLFLEKMEKELNINSTQGDWKKWSPHPMEWLWEMQYHIAKLQKAIKDGNRELILEHSADVANLAEKSFVTFGLDKCTECNGVGFLMSDLPHEVKCHKCNFN